MLAKVHSAPVRFSSAGITSDIFSSIEAMTASSPRLTWVSPDFTTSSSGTAFASHWRIARSMFPACTSFRIRFMNSVASTL